MCRKQSLPDKRDGRCAAVNKRGSPWIARGPSRQALRNCQEESGQMRPGRLKELRRQSAHERDFSQGVRSQWSQVMTQKGGRTRL